MSMLISAVLAVAVAAGGGCGKASTAVRVVNTPAGPQIAIDGEVVPPRFYFWWGGDRKPNPAAPTNCTDYTVERMAADAGVRLFEIGMMPVKAKTGLDFAACDSVMQRAIKACPQGRFLIRVNCNAPEWLLEEHPDWRMVYEKGVELKYPEATFYASPSCRGYREWVANYLRENGRHYSEKFPGHFAGLHAAGQCTGEWYYDRSWWNLCGYDRHTLAAWREYLKRQGAADWATAEVPDGPTRRTAGGDNYLLDPVKDARVIAFNRFLQEEMADLVTVMIRAIRHGVGRDRLAAAFYGYEWEFNAFRTSPAASGHYGLMKLLGDTAGDLDILCGPYSYSNRQHPDGVSTIMSAAETMRRHGVLWLNEDDARTHLNQERNASFAWLTTCEQTCELMMRNTAQEAILGLGSWWMDLPHNGWFDDPRIWEVQKQLMPIEKVMLTRPRPYTPDIAVIIGEDSQMHIACNRLEVTKPLMYFSNGEFQRAGVRFGQFILEDVLADPPPAKVQVFLSAHHLSEAQRAALDEDLRRNPDRVRVWCVADGKRFTGEPVEIKRRGQGYDITVRTPNLTKDIIRKVAELAGIHIYLKSGDAVTFADNGHVMVYATKSGKVVIDAGFAPVYDAFTNRKLADQPVFTLDMAAGQTVILRH